MTEDDGFAVRALGHGAKPPRGGPRDNSCFGTSDQFPGRHISPHRLQGWLREEIRRKLLDCETDRVRSGRKRSVPNLLSPRLPIAGGEKLPLRAVIKSDLRFFDHGCVCHLITSNKKSKYYFE